MFAAHIPERFFYIIMYSVSYARVPESLVLLLSAIKKLIAMGIGFSRSSIWLLVGKY